MKSKQKFKQTEIGEIPEDWEVKQLSNSLELLKDGTHNPPKRQEKGIKLISSGEVNYRNIDFSTCTYISEDDYLKLQKYYEIKENDVLLTIVGAYLGRVAIVKKGDLPFSAQRAVAILRPKKDLNTFFLFYWLVSPVFKRLLWSRVNATAQPGVFLGELGKLPIPLPQIQEQESIAELLSNIDSKIELNHQMNKTLESIGQAIFKRWFIDFEFPNEEGKQYKLSGGEMIDSELGKIPKNWKVEKLGDNLTTILGGTPDRTKVNYWDGDVPWINSGKVNEFRIIEPSEYITKEGLDNSATKLLPKRTTVLAITGATLGQVSLLEIDSCANQSVIGILESKEIPSEYIYFWIKNKINDIISWQTGGAQQHINKGNVDSSLFLIPKKDILIKYLEIVKLLFNKISINCFEINNLSKIRDSLLPKLMSGQIRVPMMVNE